MDLILESIIVLQAKKIDCTDKPWIRSEIVNDPIQGKNMAMIESLPDSDLSA